MEDQKDPRRVGVATTVYEASVSEDGQSPSTHLIVAPSFDDAVWGCGQIVHDSTRLYTIHSIKEIGAARLIVFDSAPG